MTRRGAVEIFGVVAGVVAVASWLTSTPSMQTAATVSSRQSTASATPAGQTATRLPDGRWLLVGGEDAAGNAVLWDPQTQTTTQTAGKLQLPRAWHSATLLADGTVLLLGGRNGNVPVETPELFDPATGTFMPIPIAATAPRASHTATLLTDGRVLVVGGSNGSAVPVPTEIWELEARTATSVSVESLSRVGHTATLMADGRVLVTGGEGLDGNPASDALAIDAVGASVQHVEVLAPPPTLPVVAASIPEPGAADVSIEARLVLRFSSAMNVASLTDQTVILTGPDGPVTTRVIAAEDGRLAFVWPAARLAEDATFKLTASGAVDRLGMPMVPASVTFTTAAPARDASSGTDPEEWVPDALSQETGWRTNRPPTPWESLAPLMAPAGVTAVSGRVLTLDGRPLPEVTLEIDGTETRSDRTGRFLLVAPSLRAGRHVLEIEGETASRPTRQYGFFEYGLTVALGQTTVLPFTIWMPKLDTRNFVTIPSPTTTEAVITTPYIPGLELHLPPQTMIRGEDGKPVTRLGITPIPVDRPPFPLAKNVEVPVYFTIQPGGAYVYPAGSSPTSAAFGPSPTGTLTGARAGGAWLVYPNYGRRAVPGQQIPFFHYDPDEIDWYVYGVGTVNASGTQVVPDARTRVYEFTGAMINSAGNSPPNSGGTPGGSNRADPVDPSTGVFLLHKTDLYLPDVIPLALTRTYNSGDNLARAFGRGMTHPYGIFLWTASTAYQEADLVLPEGGKVHFVRTSPGIGFQDAVFVHQDNLGATPPTSATPTPFYKAVITYKADTGGWNLTLKDGTVYVFGENAPLQAIRDRYGNTVTLTRAGGPGGTITQITSPHGRWIQFTYDASSRITQAKDNLGRTVTYTYVNGNLSTVTDPENNVTTYTYTAGDQLATVKDGRNIVYLTNQYTNGRVTQQTLADPGATYQFAYTVDGANQITETAITDPRGHVERLTFNPNHYVVTDVEAEGTPQARTTTIERQPGSNLVTAVVDGLSRRTEYTYDTSGHVLTVTRLAVTPAVTTTFTYEPLFFQRATVTDPLSHTWTISYDAQGTLTTLSDPLTHQTTLVLNTPGQVTSVTDPLQHTWQYGYTGGDLLSVTTPLGQTTTRFVDAAGRVLVTTDPLGRVVQTTPDTLNRVTAVRDPLGGQTSLQYDPNGRVLSLSDALSHATTYTYDASDRMATRTDPLQQSASYQYDGRDNLTLVTDRQGQVTQYQYDALDRLTLVTYADQSTTHYVYDAGDRLTQVIDSLAGTITRGYDGLDRLTSETTPEGSVSYTYDADGRRATMTVAGQPTITYGYDAAHRLTSITQGATVVALTYDDADRRSTLTLPNGIVTTYGYDNANQLTSLTYTLGPTTLGTLTYSYDAAGQRTSVGGTWARTELPHALASATYDAGNRIGTWSGTAFSYDGNGNLASDGLTSYLWNARNELTALSGATSGSFQYDGIGRRRAKTTSGTTNFLYDGPNIVQELVGATPTANVLSGGIDEVFQRADAAGVRTLVADALGSTVALTDGAGTVQTQYVYEPFGATTSSGSATGNPSQYTGRENDGTGLYFYRTRYLSPSLQRFTAEDSVGFAGGDINLHAYAFNAPTVYRDPSGRFAIPLILCAAGAGGSALADWMSGRKFDPVKAAGWCAAGMGLGLLGPEIAIGLGGTQAAAAGAETAAAAQAANLNKLHHIFDNPGHNLDSVVKALGGQQAAFEALQQAVARSVAQQGLTGTFETVVQVGGANVTVTGAVVNGAARIGTAFIP